MSEKEYKIKCENLFKRNTILLNQQKADAEQIRALQKQNGELTDKVKELEAQIEKMKCCENCKHHYFIGDELECRLLDNGINCDDEDKWEIKEKNDSKEV